MMRRIARSGLARAWFLDGDTVPAEGAIGLRVCLHAHALKRYSRDTKIRLATAPIDNGAGAKYVGAPGAKYFADFPGASARCDDILNDDGCFVRLYFKAAAQRHLAGRVAFSEKKPSPERTRDFVADDQTAYRRGHHGLDRNAGVGLFQLTGKHGAQFLRMPGMLKDQSALQVLRAV